jgi:hypothetical protein
MKKIILSVLCILSVCILNAQSQFGAISYTLPEGWIARQSGNDIEFVKKGDENSGCKITLFEQLKTVISSEKKFAELWALKTKITNTNLKKTTTPVKTEEDGWISISASKTTPNGKSDYMEGFYTLCDNSITAIIMTQAQGSSCLKEIESILASINIPIKETNSKTRAKSKKTKFPYVYRA